MPQLLGAKVRHLRIQHSLSQVELAGQLRLASSAHISRIESGKKEPSIGLLLRLCACLNTSTDYLLRDPVPIEGSDRFDPWKGSTDEPSWARFGVQLRERRLSRQLTQRAFAQQLDLRAHNFVNFLETGYKSPGLDLLVRIATTFDLSCDALLREAQVHDADTAA